MSDDIKQRLQDSSQKCITAFEAWTGNQKDAAARESLQDAVHELRKVASRLEIEIAVSERSQMTQKQMPIPAHRDKGRAQSPEADGNNNNQGDKPVKKHKLPPRKKKDDGGNKEG